MDEVDCRQQLVDYRTDVVLAQFVLTATQLLKVSGHLLEHQEDTLEVLWVVGWLDDVVQFDYAGVARQLLQDLDLSPEAQSRSLARKYVEYFFNCHFLPSPHVDGSGN